MTSRALLTLFFVGNDLDSCPPANACFVPCRAASLCNYQLRIKGLCAGRWGCGGGREDNYSQIKHQCLGGTRTLFIVSGPREATQKHTLPWSRNCKSPAGSICGQTACCWPSQKQIPAVSACSGFTAFCFCFLSLAGMSCWFDVLTHTLVCACCKAKGLEKRV